MTLDELIAEVYELTNRPDLVAMTLSAVKNATLKAHKSDFYSKDIWETGVKFSSSAHRQSIDPYTLWTNFRAWKYIRRVEDEDDDIGKFFDIITPEETINAYGSNRADIAYIAGRVTELRSSVAFSKLLIGCYVSPIVRTGIYQSWVAEQYPFAIIHEATRIVFASIGWVEEAKTQRELVAEQYAEIKLGAVQDVGY